MKSVFEGERRKLQSENSELKVSHTEGEKGEERKMNICIRHNVKPCCILLEYRKSQFKIKLQVI
jgi:hypothetical protein